MAQKAAPQFTDYITSDELAQGFQIWKEDTSTSLSCQHLGIYKTLAKQHTNPAIEVVMDTITYILNSAIKQQYILQQ